MTLEQLQDQLPEAYQPWVAQYGPAFVAMTAEEIKAWVELLIRGKPVEAYRVVVAKLPADALAGEWDALNAEWQAANATNAENVTLAKEAAAAALRILLRIALAAAGF